MSMSALSGMSFDLFPLPVSLVPKDVQWARKRLVSQIPFELVGLVFALSVHLETSGEKVLKNGVCSFISSPS